MQEKNAPTVDATKLYLELGLDLLGETPSEKYGQCPFCGGSKFYINKATGLFSCKAGACAKQGNPTSFLGEWHAMMLANPLGQEAELEKLSEDRGLAVETLISAKVVWDGSTERWYLPIRGPKGGIVNLRMYKYGQKLRGLSGVETALYGADELCDATRFDEEVWTVEGEWDKLALQELLDDGGEEGVVVAVPGSSVLKENWLSAFSGREVILGYDNDVAGMKGKRRAAKMLEGRPSSIRMIRWPEGLPEGFDVRDFRTSGGLLEDLKDLLCPYQDELGEEGDLRSAEAHKERAVDGFSLLRAGKRPPLGVTLEIYEKWLLMTPKMKDALRVMFAVVLSNQMKGDPLWVHIAAPAGHGKTELLMSLSEVSNTIVRSTLSAHSLVSGFYLPGGKDPSLLPLLIDKTFVLKDFTEILRMPRVVMDEIFSTLRGAYDGRVERQYGGPAGLRKYEGYFSFVTGVTHAIYGINNTSLGERFLIYNMEDPDINPEIIIQTALRGSQNEGSMKAEIGQAARAFLEWRTLPEDWPTLSSLQESRIIHLAQMVAMLRAVVETTLRGNEEFISYRPVHEIGTRLAKQLKKLAVCLGAQYWPCKIDEEAMRIVTATAVSSCAAWNHDALQALAKKDGQGVSELVASTRIPLSTLRDRLEKLVLQGILDKEKVSDRERAKGRPSVAYWISKELRRWWEGSGLPISRSPKHLNGKVPQPVRRGMRIKKVEG